MRTWEQWAWAGVLLVCLGIGLWMGRIVAPVPVVGVVRFDAAIDFQTSAALVDVLDQARKNDTVAAVVLEVTSPGGYATSSENIFYAILQLRAVKPVVVVVDGLAASGGYYMAAAANRIYAPASSQVGNIGTRGPRPIDPYLSPDELSSGPYKFSGGSRFDQIYQLDLTKEAFVNNVIAQRRSAELNPLKIDKRTVEEARIYLGSEAIALGLIDAEGGRTDAILAAADLAGLSQYQVVNLVQFLRADMPPMLGYSEAVRRMVDNAPPDAVFLLDSRIPLAGAQDGSLLERHMLELRRAAPASIERPSWLAPIAPVPANQQGGGS